MKGFIMVYGTISFKINERTKRHLMQIKSEDNEMLNGVISKVIDGYISNYYPESEDEK